MIGRHEGIHNFTIGQRKGLGVATGSPLYVVEIRGDSREVVVGGAEALLSKTLRAKRMQLDFDCAAVRADASGGEDSPSASGGGSDG